MRSPIGLLRERFTLLKLDRTPDGRGGYTRSWYEAARYVPGVMVGLQPAENWMEYWKGDQVRHRTYAKITLDRRHSGLVSSEDRLRREEDTQEWDVLSIVEEGDIVTATVRDVLSDQPL